MSEDIHGLVETSSNLGIIKSEGGRVTLTVSVRSAKNEEKVALRDKICEIAGSFGAVAHSHGEYPAWEFRKNSALCNTMKRVYSDMYKKEPVVIIIHAGLECGIFSEKIKDFDCVSIGPCGYDVHTTDERLSISSTVRVYDYIKNILKEI